MLNTKDISHAVQPVSNIPDNLLTARVWPLPVSLRESGSCDSLEDQVLC